MLSVRREIEVTEGRPDAASSAKLPEENIGQITSLRDPRSKRESSLRGATRRDPRRGGQRGKERGPAPPVPSVGDSATATPGRGPWCRSEVSPQGIHARVGGTTQTLRHPHPGLVEGYCGRI